MMTVSRNWTIIIMTLPAWASSQLTIFATCGSTRAGQLGLAGSCQMQPLGGDFLAHQRQSSDPFRGRRQIKRCQGFRPGDDVVGALDNVDYGEREGDDQQQQQGQCHHGDGKRPFAPEHLLHGKHEWPGRHHDHGRPDQRGKKRPQYPETGGDEDADEQYCQRCLDNIPLVVSSRHWNNP